MYDSKGDGQQLMNKMPTETEFETNLDEFTHIQQTETKVKNFYLLYTHTHTQVKTILKILLKNVY